MKKSAYLDENLNDEVNDAEECFLGLDWGESKFGFAIADNENKIASALGIFGRSEIFEIIDSFSKKHFFKKIILGINAQYFHSEENKRKVLVFKRQLEKEGFEVFLEEEFFSTSLAQINLKEAGKKNISKKDDAEAARIILQSWLDKQS